MDWNVSDRIIDGPEIKPDKFQSHAENLKGSSPQVLELCEASGIGESEPGSNNHLSESESSTKAMFDPKRQETIRVRTSNLDNIMNLVGELVINKGACSRYPSSTTCLNSGRQPGLWTNRFRAFRTK